MGNTESNESNAAGSTSEEDSARRQRENAATAVGVVMTVAAVAAAGWVLTKHLSSSASEEDEKTNDKGKCMVAVGTSSERKPMKATGGKLKMNTDGSVRGDPARAGFGGVIRDERGRWIMGFYGRILRDCTPEQAELWGIYNGLKIIQGEKLRGVEIESDSEPALIHLQNQTRKKSPMKDIIEECKGMLQSTGCKLKHIGNKENKVADRLADLGRNQETGSLVRLSTPPDQETKRLLEADARSASSY